MAQAGLSPLPDLVASVTNSDLDREVSLERRARVLCGDLVEYLAGPDPVDAIVLASDRLNPLTQMALALFHRAADGEVLVAGYDNYWMDLEDSEVALPRPRITVDKRNLHLGQALVELLIDRVENRLPPVPQVKLHRPELIVIPPA